MGTGCCQTFKKVSLQADKAEQDLVKLILPEKFRSFAERWEEHISKATRGTAW